MMLEGERSTKLHRVVLQMGLPTAAAMFLGTLYAPIDLWCASKLGAEAVVAIAFSAPLFFILMSFSSGLSQATTALIATRLGGGKTEEAQMIWTHALLLAILIGMGLGILGLWFIPAMLKAQGASGESLLLARSFSLALFGGAIAFLLVPTINSALIATGDARSNFYFLLGGCVANLVFNLSLMSVWGIVGLAISTVLVQVLGVIGLYTISKKRGWALRGYFKPQMSIFKIIISQSLPTVINMLMIPVAVFLVTKQVAEFGSEAVAGYGFAARIEHLFSMPLIGLVAPILPLAARAHGSGDSNLAFRTWTKGLALALGLSLVVAILMVYSAPWLCAFSGLSGSALEHMGRYLFFAAITLPAYPLLFSVVFFMQALGKPVYGMWMGLARHCIAPLFLLPVFAFQLGLSGVWIAILTIAWTAACFALLFGLSHKRQLTKS